MNFQLLLERFNEHYVQIEHFFEYHPYSLKESVYQAFAQEVYQKIILLLKTEPSESDFSYAIKAYLNSLFNPNLEDERLLLPTVFPTQPDSPKAIMLKDLMMLAYFCYTQDNPTVEKIEQLGFQIKHDMRPELEDEQKRLEALWRVEQEILQEKKEIRHFLQNTKQLYAFDQQMCLEKRDRYHALQIDYELIQTEIKSAKALDNACRSIEEKKQIKLNLISKLANKDSPLKILMPFLSEKSPFTKGYISIEDCIKILQHSILSDDKTLLISVSILGDETKLLTKSLKPYNYHEQRRLFDHSPYTQIIEYLLQQLEERKNAHPITLAEALKALAEAYHMGGVRGTGGEEQASIIAQEETQRFREYYLIIIGSKPSCIASQQMLGNYHIMLDLKKEMTNDTVLNDLYSLIEDLYDKECVDLKLSRILALFELAENHPKLTAYLNRPIQGRHLEDTLAALKKSQQTLVEYIQSGSYSGEDTYPLTLGLLKRFNLERHLPASLSEQELLCLINASSIEEVKLLFDEPGNIDKLWTFFNEQENVLDVFISFLWGIHQDNTFILLLHQLTAKPIDNILVEDIIFHLDEILEMLGSKKNLFMEHFEWHHTNFLTHSFEELFRRTAIREKILALNLLCESFKSHLSQELLNSSIRYALLAGSCREVFVCLKKAGADLEQPNREGETLLFIAIRSELIGAVNNLIHLGANIHHKTRFDESLIHAAARKNNIAILEMLLGNYLPCDLNNCFGQTPLLLAAQHDNIDVFKVLKKHNAKLNIQDANNQTILHYAALHNNLAMLEDLPLNKATLDFENTEGETPLHNACKSGAWEMIHLFQRYSPNANILSVFGQAPIHLAIKNSHVEILSLLKQLGANMNLKNAQGQTPLYVAVQMHHEFAIKELLSLGADINFTLPLSKTIIHVAVSMQNLRVLPLLKNHGGNLNPPMPPNRPSPLFIAAKKGYLEIVEWLIERGAKLGRPVRADESTFLEMVKNKSPIIQTRMIRLLDKKFSQDDMELDTELFPEDIAGVMGHTEVVRYIEEIKNRSAYQLQRFFKQYVIPQSKSEPYVTRP